jgi:hypothetical protein
MIVAETISAATPAGTPSINVIWIVLIALFNLGSNLATIVLAVAAFRKNRTEVSFSPNYVSKRDFEVHAAEGNRDSASQWAEINDLKKDIANIPDRLFALLANAGVIERKHK